LLSVVLLGGCAGYAADYWKPKENLISPQLVRYGFAGSQGKCVEEGLTKSLSTWQLRQLADLAKRLVPGGRNQAVLGPREFTQIAGAVKDSKVGPETRRVVQACNVALAPVAAARPAAQAAVTAPPATPPGSPAASAPIRPAQSSEGEPLWVNLGAAKTGQGIALDARSVVRGPSWRQAWFRLLNSDQGNVGDIGYLLRIDCSTRTISAHAGRKYAPAGQLIEQLEYPTPEGPMTIEPGTVIEVAYHALCDDPK
jgi:hypothetical protein